MDTNGGEIILKNTINDEIILDAIEHFYLSPYDPHENHRGDGFYNAFAMNTGMDRGLSNKADIVSAMGAVREALQDFDSVSEYLMRNQTPRGMDLAQEFIKMSPDLVRGM